MSEEERTRAMGAEKPAGDGARDFDFWMGRWNIRNRRLRERLKGSTEWDEFAATSVARPLAGGLGNEDEYRTDFAGGFTAMSFRFFNRATSQWAIYWGRQPLRHARSAGFRVLLRRHGRLRRNGYVRGPSDPDPFPLVARYHGSAALGTGRSRPTTARCGKHESGHGDDAPRGERRGGLRGSCRAPEGLFGRRVSPLHDEGGQAPSASRGVSRPFFPRRSSRSERSPSASSSSATTRTASHGSGASRTTRPAGPATRPSTTGPSGRSTPRT